MSKTKRAIEEAKVIHKRTVTTIDTSINKILKVLDTLDKDDRITFEEYRIVVKQLQIIGKEIL